MSDVVEAKSPSFRDLDLSEVEVETQPLLPSARRRTPIPKLQLSIIMLAKIAEPMA